MGRKSKKQIELEKAKAWKNNYEAKTQRKHYCLTLLPVRDKKLVEWLEEHKPINNYLKKLIMQDILDNE